jgi:hypothetical protein
MSIVKIYVTIRRPLWTRFFFQFPGVACLEHGKKWLTNRIACALVLVTMENVVVSVRDITKIEESLTCTSITNLGQQVMRL